MKTMTCSQMGGPCDKKFHTRTADEAIKAEDKHLRDVVADGDMAHVPALDAMKGRWEDPIKGIGWYEQVKKDFSAHKED